LLGTHGSAPHSLYNITALLQAITDSSILLPEANVTKRENQGAKPTSQPLLTHSVAENGDKEI